MGDGPSQTTNEKGTTAPWAPQQQYLKDMFANAQKTYNENTSQGAYTGDYVAAPSQQQYDAYGNAVTQGYNAQGVNNGLMSSGQTNAQNGAAGIGGAMSGLMNAGGDQTQANIAKAQQYAAGLNIPGAVEAAMRGAYRGAAENELPAIDRAAAASGGINSDRAALAQGVIGRGLAEKSMDLGTTMYNQAYTTGLDNAQKAGAMSNAAYASAGSLGGGLLSQGNSSMDSGIDNQTGLNAQITGGANGATGLDQQTLNNLMQKYNGGQNFDWSQLQNLYSIIGKPQGAETTSVKKTESDAGLMSNIGAGVGIASALFCDRNIKFVYAQTSSNGWYGFPTYLFSYRDDPTGALHEGPMAQDVELTHPHAVTKFGGIRVILTNKL